MSIMIIQGDCIEEMKKMEENSVDMILCDLPYGTTACKWDVVIPFEPLWEQYKRIIKDNGVIALFGNEPFSSYLRISNIKQFKYDWVWDKKLKTGHLNAKKMPMQRIEFIHIFSNGRNIYNPIMEKGDPTHSQGARKNITFSKNYGNQKANYEDKAGNTKKYPSNLISLQKIHPSKCLHPTQKPVALFEYLIRTYTNKGDLVLDNCAGSGTTGVACQITGRPFILIEKEEEYCKIAKARLSAPKQKNLF